MGRELKRVKMDFDWPLHKVYEGYVNDFYEKGFTPCPHCKDNDYKGYSVEFCALITLCRNIVVAADDSAFLNRLPEGTYKPNGQLQELPSYPGSPYKRTFPHPYCFGGGNGIDNPGKEFWKLAKGLFGEPGMLGYSSSEWWKLAELLVKQAKLPKAWRLCPACKGTEGTWDPEIKKKYNRWRPKGPPKGKGYQMWETVSEGSPISPVFATPDELAQWLADHEGGTFQQWRATIDAEWVPSMIAGPGIGVMTGVEAAGAGVL